MLCCANVCCQPKPKNAHEFQARKCMSIAYHGLILTNEFESLRIRYSPSSSSLFIQSLQAIPYMSHSIFFFFYFFFFTFSICSIWFVRQSVTLNLRQINYILTPLFLYLILILKNDFSVSIEKWKIVFDFVVTLQFLPQTKWLLLQFELVYVIIWNAV